MRNEFVLDCVVQGVSIREFTADNGSKRRVFFCRVGFMGGDGVFALNEDMGLKVEQGKLYRFRGYIAKGKNGLGFRVTSIEELESAA